MMIQTTIKDYCKERKLVYVFCSMRKRCYNSKEQSYPHYGGRGITICQQWLDYPKDFIAWALANGWDWGLEIDRKNNDGNYEPDNCQFVTHQVNQTKQGLRKTNKTGYIGVTYSSTRNKYRVSVTNCDKRVNLGYHTSAKHAAKLRDRYITQHGLTNTLNFQTSESV